MKNDLYTIVAVEVGYYEETGDNRYTDYAYAPSKHVARVICDALNTDDAGRVIFEYKRTYTFDEIPQDNDTYDANF